MTSAAFEAGGARRGWSASNVHATLVLVRHGVTAHTLEKRFSGGLGGADLPLTDDGREQARRAGRWVATHLPETGAVVASPLRRTAQTAEHVAPRLEVGAVETDPGFAEMEFGAWEGLTFAEVAERDPEALAAWRASSDVAPPGGESFASARARVLAARDHLLARRDGGTTAVVTHVTPIKLLVADALGAPLEALYRMELSPASITVIGYDARGGASLRLFNHVPV
ncbi:histidine phosphatase family protein [Nocardioides acrostichi]|uniref:Histidine phosphatase family protein n=1 Tax=Nocardioides acrostichi TaxID=2784339 RepID=A0A930V325_9ACTN|nr:histidine phosphatase family protein [Nocardioides acrostichi]MBF4162840.1 histidine phosphatase family protein [Nocardioides acrostichi]